jgi:two-component system cell cycle sensor histidine kinase/response regulator CckA
LLIAGALAACVLLGVAWIHSLRRRVRQQTEQIREHMAQQARRDTGVQNAARLESLGVLAGGVAHDFNNLLTVIMGNLALMKLSPAIMETEAHRVTEIERGVQRAKDLARQLLTFATGGEPLRVPMDVAEAVRIATETVLRGTNVRAEYAVEAGLWAGDADRDQLMQAVQNVVHNALQAMPDGGVVRLGLTNEALEPGKGGEDKAGRFVKLTVTDSGPGIAPEILPKIFDPYFTTRRGARGLGLATVYSIVNRHGGRVEATSTPGHGTTVTLRLPATMLAIMKDTPAAGIPAPAMTASVGKPRVLIMDDEEGVRDLATTVLRRMDLDVTAVADGESALHEFEIARNAGRPHALLIVDLTIPGGMGGKETVEAVRKLDPTVPAIVTSGYSSDPVLTKYESYGFQAVVAKPFEVLTLANAVRRFIPQAKPI